ncbi:ABC transporter permease subunit [Planctomonas sp. JC2975]|uniref:ABC transporter permease subunit n=1 Tax=Planctomonas sp. JC2975 TaxID=2729626 RepID=UPI0014750CAE|nr:ABC transporter permease subunit [Planctomonas sp. JC2975]NNC10855.1 ABC transporter permease subunit [Planctomonas sp. JC2975]
MTAAIGTLNTPAPAASPLDGIRLRFGGVLRSEWIKLRSLRSTVWCLGIVIVLAVGVAGASAALLHLENPSTMSSDIANGYLVSAATVGLAFTQLAVAVLGVLVISGEYATGMIRSTYTADPRRLGAYFGKFIVLAVVVFVVGIVTEGVSAILATVIFHARGLEADLTAPSVLLPLLGGALYLTLIAVLAFAIGSVLRSSAGGIATILGMLLVLPVVAGLIAGLTQAKWVANVASFLPASAGDTLYAYTPPNSTHVEVSNGIISLEAWQGGLVLLAWVVVVTILGAILTKRRDV